MKVQFATYKGKGKLFNRLIRFWTQSEFSHCEIVIDGFMYSSSIMDGGVRMKPFHDDENWELIDLPWASSESVLTYHRATFNHQYDFADLITRHILHIPTKGNSGQFCSEWCAAALGIPNARDYSPAALLDLVLFVNDKLNPVK